MRITESARFKTRHWFIGIVMLAVVGICIVVSQCRSPSAPLKASAEFLSSTQTFVTPPPSLFERWVPMSWGWLWRLRDKVRGPKETVSIQATVVECSTDAEQAWISELGEPMTQTNGMRGWVADELALRKLEMELAINWKGKRLMSPRVNTSHGILSTMWSGTSVGLSMGFLSKAQGGGTELMTRTCFTESVTNSESPPVVSIRTNLDGVARWQLPPGTGFVLVGPPHADGSRRSAMLFSVQIQRPK
jgi:hypothetical protein